MVGPVPEAITRAELLPLAQLEQQMGLVHAEIVHRTELLVLQLVACYCEEEQQEDIYYFHDYLNKLSGLP